MEQIRKVLKHGRYELLAHPDGSISVYINGKYTGRLGNSTIILRGKIEIDEEYKNTVHID